VGNYLDNFLFHTKVTIGEFLIYCSMKALFIAPLPPPFTGNSLPVKLLFDDLKVENTVDFVDVNKVSHKSGITSVGRVLKILKMLFEVFRRHKQYDLIYLTVAESFAGNCRDLAIYWICRKRLNSVVLHMLGGAAMKEILTPSSRLQYRINKYFVSKIGGIVVEGQEQANTFAQVASREKIRIINNFAEDYLFLDLKEFEAKHSVVAPLRLLFLSNMLEGKGHMELLKTYLLLPEEIQAQLHIDFAGKFLYEEEQAFFMEHLKNKTNLVYHGSVSGTKKRDLYSKAHVFCLPTYYPYEGQPFCIVEAYAAGCLVITTNHSGIRYIFTPELNGIEVEKKSLESISTAIIKILNNPTELKMVGRYNLEQAKIKYTANGYLNSMKSFFSTVLTNA
jgi:glycosyltransferase involved in cell wall biosynthesis